MIYHGILNQLKLIVIIILIVTKITIKYFYANNLVISSLPMERRSLFSRSHKNLSLGESMLDIVNRISEGTLGQTFSTTKIFDYLDLESAYTELSEDRKSHGSVALRWSQN